MSIQDFAEALAQKVRDTIEFRAEVIVHPVVKNNDVSKMSIVIREENSNVSPTIYLEEMYKNYDESGDMEKLSNQVINTYLKYRLKGNVDVGFLADYERVKDDIVCQLVNARYNMERLKECPKKEFLDMTICFSIITTSIYYGCGSVLVTNALMEAWGVGLEELYSQALANTMRRSPEVNNSILDYIERYAISEVCKEEFRECYRYVPMRIITTKTKEYGAVALLYSKSLKEMADYYQDDIMLIPSSVHEFIAFPASIAENLYYDMSALVREVNRTFLDAIEILSDHVYYYLREKDEILTEIPQDRC